MKFELPISLTHRKTVEVEADTPEAAIIRVRAENPGWQCDSATQMENGEPVTDFEVMATCESCDRLLFDIEDYQSDYEGIPLCNACARASREEGEQP